jgi:hypothetical protein
MRWTFCGIALALILGSASAAQGAPGRGGGLSMTAPDDLFILVGGCHQDEEDHYVPEVGRSLPHVHIGEDCEPYRLSDSDADGGYGDDEEESEGEDQVDPNEEGEDEEDEEDEE